MKGEEVLVVIALTNGLARKWPSARNVMVWVLEWHVQCHNVNDSVY